MRKVILSDTKIAKATQVFVEGLISGGIPADGGNLSNVVKHLNQKQTEMPNIDATFRSDQSNKKTTPSDTINV